MLDIIYWVYLETPIPHRWQVLSVFFPFQFFLPFTACNALFQQYANFNKNRVKYAASFKVLEDAATSTRRFA